MENNEKIKYLKELNKEYHYKLDKINYLFDSKYKICENKEIQNIKLLNNDKVNKILDLLKIGVNFLEKNNITYWLDGGTLLGAQRNNKFIPWDDDADLAIPIDSYIKLKQIIKKYPLSVENDIKYRICDEFNIKFMEMMNKDDNFSFLIKIYPKENIDVFIDLILYITDGKTYYPNSSIWKNRYFYKVENIYPLKKINFENNLFWCVNKPEQYLNSGYHFWKHLIVASHAHYDEIKKYRNKQIYYKIK